MSMRLPEILLVHCSRRSGHQWVPGQRWWRLFFICLVHAGLCMMHRICLCTTLCWWRLFFICWVHAGLRMMHHICLCTTPCWWLWMSLKGYQGQNLCQCLQVWSMQIDQNNISGSFFMQECLLSILSHLLSFYVDFYAHLHMLLTMYWQGYYCCGVICESKCPFMTL